MSARVEFWWWAEKASGRLWDRSTRDGVSCRWDWLTAFTYRQRRKAERRQHPELFL